MRPIRNLFMFLCKYKWRSGSSHHKWWPVAALEVHYSVLPSIKSCLQLPQLENPLLLSVKAMVFTRKPESECAQWEYWALAISSQHSSLVKNLCSRAPFLEAKSLLDLHHILRFFLSNSPAHPPFFQRWQITFNTWSLLQRSLPSFFLIIHRGYLK